MSVRDAFHSFMTDFEFEKYEFEKAVDQSTLASFWGSGYSVELFNDGTYRVLWDQQIGNQYQSPGLILSVPALSDEEWDDDPTLRYYENARDLIRENFEEHYWANLATQYEIANRGLTSM